MAGTAAPAPEQALRSRGNDVATGNHEGSKESTKSADLVRPFKVAGTTFQLFAQGLTVTKPPSFVGRICRKLDPPVTIAWSDLASCELKFTCFMGSMIIRDKKGKTMIIKGFTYRLRKAALVIYQQMNKSVSSTFDGTITEALGNRPRVMVLGNGVVVKKVNSNFSGCYEHVPWESVVMVSYRGGNMNISTIIPDAKAHARVSQGSRGAHADPHHTCVVHGPAFVNVSVKGKAAKMEEVFNLVAGLMSSQSTQEAPLQGTDDIEKVEKIKGSSGIRAPNTKFTTRGIRTKAGSTTYFLPWKQATNIEYSKPAFGAGCVVVTDRVGNRIPLKGFGVDEYDRFREIYIAQTVGHKPMYSGETWATSPIVRKGMRIAADGVTIPKRKGLTTSYLFYPWTVIDGMEMEAKYGHRSIALITESGDPLTAASSWFGGSSALLETLVKLRHMKYQDSADPDAQSCRWFAGARGSVKACVLTDVSVRFVAQKNRFCKITCWLDLDSVNSAEIYSPKKTRCFSRKGKFLVVYISKAMAEAMRIDDEIGDNEMEGLKRPSKDESMIVVKLKPGDNDKQIKDEIMKRMRARKADEARKTRGPNAKKPVGPAAKPAARR